MSEQKENDDSKSRGPSRLWLPIVLIIGGLLGVLVYQATNSQREIFYRFPFQGHDFEYEALRAFHIILSTVGIVLIIALIIVYVRTYIQTKANFILGLLIVLFALLLQSLLTYQVFLDFMGPGPSGLFPSNFSSPIADVFMIVAYAVFLYLSLE
jgi:hypothetical protein